MQMKSIWRVWKLCEWNHWTVWFGMISSSCHSGELGLIDLALSRVFSEALVESSWCFLNLFPSLHCFLIHVRVSVSRVKPPARPFVSHVKCCKHSAFSWCVEHWMLCYEMHHGGKFVLLDLHWRITLLLFSALVFCSFFCIDENDLIVDWKPQFINMKSVIKSSISMSAQVDCFSWEQIKMHVSFVWVHEGKRKYFDNNAFYLLLLSCIFKMQVTCSDDSGPVNNVLKSPKNKNSFIIYSILNMLSRYHKHILRYYTS